MKAQINNPVIKHLIIVLMILSYIAGSYAQKSASELKEIYNFKRLKNFVEVLNNKEMNYTGQYVQLSEASNETSGSIGSEIDKINFTPEWTTGDDFIVSEDEEELVVEDWMLDENHFRTTDHHYEIDETAEEEKPVIEDWMLDESHFLSYSNLNEKENTAKDKLKVEDWMLDPEHWVSRAD